MIEKRHRKTRDELLDMVASLSQENRQLRLALKVVKRKSAKSKRAKKRYKKLFRDWKDAYEDMKDEYIFDLYSVDENGDRGSLIVTSLTDDQCGQISKHYENVAFHVERTGRKNKYDHHNDVPDTSVSLLADGTWGICP